MGSTLTTLRTGLQTYLGVSSSDNRLTDARANLAINWAIDEIASWTDWQELRRGTTLTLAADTSGYAFSAMAVELRMIRTARIGNDVLERITRENLLSGSDDSETGYELRGRPIQYSVSQNIDFFPTPDKVYTVNLSGTIAPTTLTNGSDTTELPSSIDHAIVLVAALNCIPMIREFEIEESVMKRVGDIRNNITDEASRARTPIRPNFRKDWGF